MAADRAVLPQFPLRSRTASLAYPWDAPSQIGRRRLIARSVDGRYPRPSAQVRHPASGAISPLPPVADDPTNPVCGETKAACLRRAPFAGSGDAGARDLASRMLGQVENCAAWLSACGCRPPDIVGITIADEYTHMVASLALLYLGVPQVCLPTHDPVSMRLHLTQRLPVTAARMT